MNTYNRDRLLLEIKAMKHELPNLYSTKIQVKYISKDGRQPYFKIKNSN